MNAVSWSPIMPPPRMTEKASEPSLRGPVMPSCGGTRISLNDLPRPLAAASPIIKAVPDGASTFRRWWPSVISMSQSVPSRAATCSTSPIIKLTPSEKFRSRTMAIRFACSATCCSCCGERPVVPMIAALIFVSLRSSRASSEACGVVKSIHTSADWAAFAALSLTVQPPWVAPSAGDPARSLPPATAKSSPADLTSAWPIRPAMPAIAILMLMVAL